VRRRLFGLLPALCKFYGLRPWEVEELTGDEVDEFVRQWRVEVEREVSSGA
jgi:hypothetical protein